jgi:hypothetical protein
VKYQAQRLPQNSIWPMSQTSLTSGWRMQNSLGVVVSGDSFILRGQFWVEVVFLPGCQGCVEHESSDNEGQD